MTATPLLTDEVWRQLDHGPTRLGRRDKLALAAVVVAVALVLTVVIVARASGEIQPRLSMNASTTNTTGRTVVATLAVHNGDWSTETITAVAAPSPGTRVTSIAPSRLSIPAGKTRTLTVHVSITNCSTLGTSDHEEQLRLHLHRWWGSATAKVSYSFAAPQSGC